ncbi:hypothetical protein PWY87_27840 [Kribbella solani]|uniref:Uncharacterized protein n=1 Tax=Kribbella solani TaxID=236067 RepID=A0A841DQD1_9ACTN|nr:hypothetical protein [Kribbella solani]MBB5980111.1 hypothetical protein [Kribbella solani]MDX3005522.1 hypothetical protein [Kribbella solani]
MAEPSKPIRYSWLGRPWPVCTAYTLELVTTTDVYPSCHGMPGTFATTWTAPVAGDSVTSFAT